MSKLGVIPVPTERQLQAWALRKKKGLTDSRIAFLLGITRESANRLIARCDRQIEALREHCQETSNFSLIESIDLQAQTFASQAA